MAPGHRGAGLRDQLEHVPVAEEDAGEVGEAVPPQLEEAEVERDGVEPEAREVDRRHHQVHYWSFLLDPRSHKEEPSKGQGDA